MDVQKVLKNLTEDQILNKLKEDENYYGDFGQNFLSNSDVGKLIKNPNDFHKPGDKSVPLVVGGAFHTMMLEPEKIGNYQVVDASSRNTKIYKEAADGEVLLLRSDWDHLETMCDKFNNNDLITGVIRGENVEVEVPAIKEICGEWWKGKADVLNHDDRLIIDLKTTADITKFRASAQRYNYDSQAFIYRQLFGYDVVFVVIDKKTLQLGFYDCSEEFYLSGKEKVVEAVYAYRMYYKDQKEEEFDWSNYLLTETL